MADRSANGAFRGWSALVAPFLNLSLINTAVSPSSVRTTFNSSQWERTLSFVKKGDFLVLEFGIEDEGDPAFKPKNGSYNLRPSLSGTGDETITLNYTTVDTVKFPNGTTKVVAGSAKNVTEVVHTFGWYLKNMIVDARDKEAHVIISSRIPKNWKPVAMTGNKTIDTLPTDYKFRDYAQQVAKELFVDFVDHTQYTLRYLREKGPVASNKLYGYREPRNNQEIRTDVYLSRDGGKGTRIPLSLSPSFSFVALS